MTPAQTLAPVKAAIRAPYAWPGGYPLFAVMHDGGALCIECARVNWRNICASTIAPHTPRTLDGWEVAAIDVNWEDNALSCDHCNCLIESAYGEA